MPSDPTETDLIEKRYGSLERVFDCANRQWTVDFANNGGRDTLGNEGAEAMKKRAETWRNDGSGSGAGRVIVKPVSIKDEDREKFDDEQRKMLREQYGIDI
jgi:hypothetical protein